MKLLGRFRKKTADNPVYRKVGYFNGVCPFCLSHVGVDVLENILTKTQHKFCAVCGRDII